jgi:UDP-3-O-[3-hydroxymyristoyl] glucosamine N-acyltransferase
MSAPTAHAEESLTVGEIAQRLGGSLRGEGDFAVKSINALSDAGPDDITFITTAEYARQWPQSKAAAAIVSASLEQEMARHAVDRRPLIFVDDAERGGISLLEMFQKPEPVPDLGVHSSAIVHSTAHLGRKVRIGPHVTVDCRATIGNDVVLHAGVRIYADVSIGDDSILHANTVVRHGCTIGRDVILHQNVSIGADGFGYRPLPGGAGLSKVPHIGTVIIEDGVEIGANSCVDRAKFGATIVGAGTKIDNLCQIAHNCRIGRYCVIAGQTGIAGSVIVGDGVQIGGQVGIIDHLTIGAGVKIGARAVVLQSIPAGESWTGYPAGELGSVLRQWAGIRKLPELLRRLSGHGSKHE